MATIKDSVINDTGYLRLPVGTSAQRPGSPVIGDTRLNTDRNLVEFYSGTTWVGIGQFEGSGGTVTTAGGYRTHVFTSPGNLIGSQGSASAEVLIVAGGGGGGGSTGGGGGAGGLLYGTNVGIVSGTNAVTVGAGVARTLAYEPAGNVATSGTNGNPSSFLTFTAVGGGGGGSGGDRTSSVAKTGGSGGGGYAHPGNSPASGVGFSGTQTPNGIMTGYGNAGGDGNATGNGYSGGGGGAGAAGASGQPSFAGAGGAGRTYSISGTSTTYAGGGGGGANTNGAAGGSGGGGNGASYNGAPSTPGGYDATANTGGGGGGGWLYQGGGGGAGGSGIIIIKYPYG
jgi:hypothetical protein